MAFFFGETLDSSAYQNLNSPDGHLREIAAFLRATPDAWTQNKEARSGSGDCVEPMSPWARSWCLLGLVERFIRNAHRRQVALRMLMRVMPVVNGHKTPVHVFNDEPGRKITEVIGALELASTIPAGEPLGQDEYCALSRAYHHMMHHRLFSNDFNPLKPKEVFSFPKLPDWNAISEPSDVVKRKAVALPVAA